MSYVVSNLRMQFQHIMPDVFVNQVGIVYLKFVLYTFKAVIYLQLRMGGKVDQSYQQSRRVCVFLTLPWGYRSNTIEMFTHYTHTSGIDYIIVSASMHLVQYYISKADLINQKPLGYKSDKPRHAPVGCMALEYAHAIICHFM